ncbi:MAG: response regulator [Thermoguttaceae bacterium]|jgi:CheY-like chemotaxis protein
MCTAPKAFTLLMADDDVEDCLLVREALLETRVNCELHVVNDGEELLDYLHGRGKYAEPRTAPHPDLLLLDLRMPKKDGREVLVDLKADRHLPPIPVVVLTTSTADDDVAYCYRLGASSYIPKPATFQAWVDLMRTLSKYWFELVKLPPWP